jgi:hypothetical protein
MFTTARATATTFKTIIKGLTIVRTLSCGVNKLLEYHKFCFFHDLGTAAQNETLERSRAKCIAPQNVYCV